MANKKNTPTRTIRQADIDDRIYEAISRYESDPLLDAITTADVGGNTGPDGLGWIMNLSLETVEDSLRTLVATHRIRIQEVESGGTTIGVYRT